jgi:transcriptional regulator with XRE-family HTH domain
MAAFDESPRIPRSRRQGSLNGTEVRRRRIAIGWSREQLAAYVGVPAREVAEWESGDAEIELTVAVRFALENGEAERRDHDGPPHRTPASASLLSSRSPAR